MDEGMIRFSQWSVGGGMKCVNFEVIQRVLLSGGAFKKLFVFGELVCEATFDKVTKGNN